MVYGAYGFTGQWIVEAAVERGHRPLLAGRDAKKLRPVAERFGLESRVLSLSEPGALRDALGPLDAVMHAAGPYVCTSEPMLEACLETGTDYVDITGEVSVLKDHFTLDERAREAGVAILGGMGFDVVPTDCLARHVADGLERVEELELVVDTDINPTAGTVKSALGMLPAGGQVRRHGQLRREPVGHRTLSVDFPHGPRTASSAPLGDLVTAAHSTGADSITTYVVLPRGVARVLQFVSPLLGFLLRFSPIRNLAERLVDRVFTGPDRTDRDWVENWIYARARSREGNTADAWLKTPETYWFTALSCVEAVEILAERDVVGARSPSMAFGTDFVLRIPGVERFDSP